MGPKVQPNLLHLSHYAYHGILSTSKVFEPKFHIILVLDQCGGCEMSKVAIQGILLLNMDEKELFYGILCTTNIISIC